MGIDENEELQGAKNQMCHVVKHPRTFFLVNLAGGRLPLPSASRRFRYGVRCRGYSKHTGHDEKAQESNGKGDYTVQDKKPYQERK